MKKPTLLIIDDNYDSRLSIKAALRKNGYDFFEAEQGYYISEPKAELIDN